jgi:uncharacterized membrane protein YfcA
MTIADALLIVGIGLVAGTLNTVVGSGTSISFPALVLLGYPPLVSNISNKVGLLPGALAGIAGYRRELAAQRGNIALVVVIGIVGGLGGGLLLVVLPRQTFSAVAPVFILLATLLFLAQPVLSRRSRRTPESGRRSRRASMCTAVVGTVYGGYFGAGQGVIYIAALSTMIPQSLHRVIALKNVLAAVVVATSSLLFVAAAHVDYLVALFLALGSICGGFLGAAVGRRLPEVVLRAVVVAVGLAAAAVLLV